MIRIAWARAAARGWLRAGAMLLRSILGETPPRPGELVGEDTPMFMLKR